MEKSLFLWALLLVALGGLFSLSSMIVHRKGRDNNDRLSSGAWCMLAAILAAGSVVTYPLHHLYSQGHGPGIGFAIGGVAALLVIVVTNKIGERNDLALSPLPSFAAAAVLTAAIIPEIWFRHKLLDVQCGVMMGWVAEVFMWMVLTPRTNETRRAISAMLAATGLLVTVASGMLISEARAQLVFGSGISAIHWSALIALGAAPIPAIIAVVALAARYAVRLPGASTAALLTSRWLTTDGSRGVAIRLAIGTASGVVGLFAFRALQVRAASHPPLFAIAATGVIAGTVIYWLVATVCVAQATTEQSVYRNISIGILIITATCISAYQRSAGFGMTLVMVGAWNVVLMQASAVDGDGKWGASASLATAGVLMTGTVLVVYRLVGLRFYEDLHWLSHTTHYQLFGLVTGLFGALFASSLIVKSDDGEKSSLSRSAVSGLAAALVGPFLAVSEIVIFGPKCCEGFVMGCVLACGIAMVTKFGLQQNAQGSVVAALTVLSALTGPIVLSEWLHSLLPLSLLSRAARAHMVLEGAVLISVLVLAQGIRLGSRGRRSDSRTEQP